MDRRNLRIVIFNHKLMRYGVKFILVIVMFFIWNSGYSQIGWPWCKRTKTMLCGEKAFIIVLDSNLLDSTYTKSCYYKLAGNPPYYTVTFKYGFNNGVKHGKEISWWSYPDFGGFKNRERHWDMGKPTGTWTNWTSKGNLKKVVDHTNGKSNGDAISYYRTGRVKSKIIYGDDAVLDSIVKFYFDGNHKSIESFDAQGELALWTKWFENGQKNEEYRVDKEEMFLINYWSEKGEQLIINGSGTMLTKRKSMPEYSVGSISVRVTYKNGKIVNSEIIKD